MPIGSAIARLGNSSSASVASRRRRGVEAEVPVSIMSNNIYRNPRAICAQDHTRTGCRPIDKEQSTQGYAHNGLYRLDDVV